MENRCSKAIMKMTDLVDISRRLPLNVFMGHWGGFFFFDSDWMFSDTFLESLQDLRRLERSECICIRSLDGPALFLVEGQTTTADYGAVLAGTGPEDGLVYDFGRFACTSDIGEWAIYCERRNEIAVLAVKPGSTRKYLSVLHALKAEPIAQAIRDEMSYGFSDRAISISWREELIRHYPPPVES
jgi:hypothetical protein